MKSSKGKCKILHQGARAAEGAEDWLAAGGALGVRAGGERGHQQCPGRGMEWGGSPPSLGSHSAGGTVLGPQHKAAAGVN